MYTAFAPSILFAKPKWLITWCLVFLLFITAFAPGGIHQYSATDPHTFVLATNYDGSTLDPALAYDTASGEMIQNIYETLIFYDGAKTDAFVPQLASSYELSADGLTWTFHIRPGVTFHDGASLTPSDVAYSLQRGLLQGGTSSPQWLLTEPFLGIGIDDISLLVDPYGSLYDDRAALSVQNPAVLLAACNQVKAAIVADNAAGTITMHLAQPWGPFLITLAGPWGSIVDRDWAVARGAWNGSCSTWQNWYAMSSDEDPLSAVANGTGPFKLDHWFPGQELLLSRHNSYWRTPAQLEGVLFQVVPDATTRLKMLHSGKADEIRGVSNLAAADQMVGEDCTWNINTEQYDCSTVNENLLLRRYTGRPAVTQFHSLFNFEITTVGGNPYVGSGKLNGFGIPGDFFADVHIRKAFSYCFNWDTYDQMVYSGEFVQTPTLALEGMPGYDLNAPHYSFDLAACETELGLADVDQDGIPSASDPNDVTQMGFTFKIPYNEGNLSRQAIAEILSASFAQVDPKFVIDAVSLPYPDYLTAQRNNYLPFINAGWHEDIHDPHNWYGPFLTGVYSYQAHVPSALRGQFSIFLDQGVTTTDFAARHAIYQQVNQLVYDTAPLILLGGAANHDFIQRWVSGRVLNQAFMGNYYYPIDISSADIDITLGAWPAWSHDLVPLQHRRVTFIGLNSGPVQLESTDHSNLVVSQRVLYGGVSYSEMMGLPAEQLSKEYLFPYYNNVAMGSQLRVSNLGDVPTTIKVHLGTQEIDSFPLAAGAAERKSYPNANSGPLRVVSTDTDILTTIRVLYGSKSYSELMGYPLEQLSKEYWFPVYDNMSTSSQLRVSNVGAAPTTIKVYLAGEQIDMYDLQPGEASRKNYTGRNTGPLHVVSSTEPILSTIRLLYKNKSYAELTGLPAEQLSQKALYPVYDNVGLASQLRVSNVGAGSTTITVYAAGRQIDTFTLLGGKELRKVYSKNTGPLAVVSSTEPIVSSIRMIYNTAAFSSLYEMMGLPDAELSTQYFFPWYNNTAMKSELRFAVP